jgi:hypothetical protein
MRIEGGVQPMAAVWIEGEAVVGVCISEATDVTDEELAKSFAKAVSEPMHRGPPTRPKKVRVESASLARRLRTLLSGVAIEIRPTPEVDAFVAAMKEAFEGPAADDMLLFLDTPEPWRPELSRMAHELLEAQPWEIVPPTPALEVRIPELELEDGRIAVMGHNGETFGLMVFFSPEDLATFEKAADAPGRSPRRGLPRCLSVNLAELAPSPDGEPESVALVMVFEGRERRTPSEREMKIAIASTCALCRFVTDEAERLETRAAWLFGVKAKLDVTTLGERLAVELRAGLFERGQLDTVMAAAGRGERGGAVPRAPKARAPKAARSARTFAYTNRMGDTYHLHEGRTKLGKPRYFFAREVRDGALAVMPDGYEVSESINGVVSVRRIDPDRTAIPAADVATIDAERARHAHLMHHRVQAERDAIVIYAPDRDAGVLDRHALFPVSEAKRQEWMNGARYAPVFRFVPDRDAYRAQRMTYRGAGGWSRDLARGALKTLAKKFVPKIGTEEFFELI